MARNSRSVSVKAIFQQYCISHTYQQVSNGTVIFIPVSYQAIVNHPKWSRRLHKPHPRMSSIQLCEDTFVPRELDSCCSSDALLMNLFCHPRVEANEIFVSLFDFHNPPELEFGFKAKLPFTDGGSEPSSSEIDSSYPTR
jgi:hypothetical protein